MNILDQLCEKARERVSQAKSVMPARELERRARSMPEAGFAFEKALKKPELGFICEIKRASPSKGVISRDFPYMQIAKEYEAAGVDCISVLTEPEWFLGSGEYLREISSEVCIPCLRKDFIVDEYMIYEARLLGASAVLLICSVLTDAQLKSYIGICDELGLSTLVETHDTDEISRALAAGARMIGVNNRNLKDFSVDTGNSAKLRTLVPDNVIFVAESGIKTPGDIRALRQAHVDAVLIGEALMTAPDRADALRNLRGEA